MLGLFIVLAIAVAVGVMVYRLTGGDAGLPAEVFTRTPDAEPASGSEPDPNDVRLWAGGEVSEHVAATSPPSDPARIQLSPDAEPIPVVRARPSWHARLNGAMGLVVAVGLGAITIALTFYVVGRLLLRMLSLGDVV